MLFYQKINTTFVFNNMITDFRLTVFITVARTLSFTRAAAVLNVSQPAISKHIKELEADFGEPLFIRRGNSIELSDKGQSIIPHIEAILDSYSTLSDAISSEDNRYQGTLTIGASTTIAQYALPSILAKFNSYYPEIKLLLISANSDEILNHLRRKDIDIALIEGGGTSNSFHYSHFAPDEIVLVSTNKGVKDISARELTTLPLLLREEGSGTLSVILSALEGQGIKRRDLTIKMQLGSSEAIIRYLKASSSYALLSTLIVEEQLKHGELFAHTIGDLKIKREFRFATLQGKSSRLITLFKEFCISAL